MKPTLVVLAAGIGSRYGGLKQIDPVDASGRIILDYSIHDAAISGFSKVVFVIRPEIESDFKALAQKNYENKIECDYVAQKLDMVPDGFNVPAGRTKPWGTGHAVLVCRDKCKSPFAIINADDFYGPAAYQQMAKFLSEVDVEAELSRYAMVGYTLANTLSEHGTVSRGICAIDASDRLESVTERLKIAKRPDGIAWQDEAGQWSPLSGREIVSLNFWGFTPSAFQHLDRLFNRFLSNGSNLENEFLLPSAVDNMIKDKSAEVTVLCSHDRWVGVTYPQDKEMVSRHIQDLIDNDVYPKKF